MKDYVKKMFQRSLENLLIEDPGVSISKPEGEDQKAFSQRSKGYLPTEEKNIFMEGNSVCSQRRAVRLLKEEKTGFRYESKLL